MSVSGGGSNSEVNLSKLEKIACAVSGPVVGIFPPRLQIQRLGYDGACVASSSSRVFNAAWSVYAAASLVAKVFGVDIDPTAHNLITYFGIPVGLDTILREFLYGFHYVLNDPFSSYTEPWGEPLISIIDQSRHPEWYSSNEETVKNFDETEED